MDVDSDRLKSIGFASFQLWLLGEELNDGRGDDRGENLGAGERDLLESVRGKGIPIEHKYSSIILAVSVHRETRDGGAACQEYQNGGAGESFWRARNTIKGFTPIDFRWPMNEYRRASSSFIFSAFSRVSLLATRRKLSNKAIWSKYCSSEIQRTYQHEGLSDLSLVPKNLHFSRIPQVSL